MKTVGLVSLGCAKNRVDAEHLLGGLVGHGFQVVENLRDAEVIIVNTCGFIREAVEESIDEILEVARLKAEGTCRTLVVAGCLPKRYPEIADEMPEVDRFFTPDDLARIPQWLGGVGGAPGHAPERLLTQASHSTYLKIADGCSNRCSFCTIPSIRGPYRSVPADTLVAEAERLVTRGVRELNVVAQDITRYGEGGDDPRALDHLLGRLEAIRDLHWIRLLYAYPRPFPPGVVERLAAGGNVVPYLDIPVQHIHPEMLRAMARKTSAGAVEAVLADLVGQVPHLVLRTTAIVGFPGETDEMFETLVSFVKRVRFHHLGVFAYSPEEGTPARALGPRIPPRVVDERLEHLLEVQADISEARNREFLGRDLDVLVEGFDEQGRVVGRTYGQAPEVDGLTHLVDDPGAALEIGSFVSARVVEADVYDLTARVGRT